MRPYCFLLTSLLAMACAPHPAVAAGPRAADDPDRSEHDHDHEPGEGHGEGHGRGHGGGHSVDLSGTVDESLSAKPNGSVSVHSFTGSVHVTGTAQNQLKVHAGVTDGCRVDIVPSGDRFEIGLQCSHGEGSADLEIQVPQGSSVDVRTMSAGVAIQGVNGSLRLQSVTSDLEVKGGAPTDIEARTTSGSVHIDAASSQVRAQSVSGDVTVKGAHGKATVHTVSGDCAIGGGDFSDVRFETVSGTVAFTGGIVGSFEAQSHSGDVTMHLPPATNADVELRTFSGDLEIDLGTAPKKMGERELDAKLGVGGPRVHVRTFSGDVKLTR